MYSFPPDSTGFVQRMPVGSILHHQKEFRNIHLLLFQFFPCWNLVRICIWTWDSITHRNLAICLLSGICPTKWCHRWGLCGGGTYALFKRISLPPKRGKGSCNNKCRFAMYCESGQAPGIPAQSLQQFATLEIPLRSVTKVVTSNKLKLK